MLTDDYELREIKLNEGDYVRTREGIDQFEYTHKGNYGLVNYKFKSGNDITNPEYYVLKSSLNIIDLIEVGDYVNGHKITNIAMQKKFLYTEDEQIIISPENIKSIVTKEQFEEMEFKVNG